MRLDAARVTHYKSVEDSGEFTIGDLTCLVGKNESGKTAVLRALHRLQPDDPDQKSFDIEIEYPRHQLFDYRNRHASSPDTVITTTWTLDPTEAQWFEDTFGPSVLRSPRLTIRRGYDNVNYWTFDLDERAAVRNLVADSGLDQQDKDKLQQVSALHDLATQAGGLDESTRRDEFVARLTALIGGADTMGKIAINRFSEHLPTFVYYSTYDALPGEVSLEQLIQLEQQPELPFPLKIFKALLSLVGVTPKDVSETSTFESLKASLEAISISLSREIFEYWSQNRNLEVEFNFDAARPGDKPPFNSGYVFRTRIKNKRYGTSVSFNERSTGFVWFFSFLVWFSQMKREHGERVVLLLDEPG